MKNIFCLFERQSKQLKLNIMYNQVAGGKPFGHAFELGAAAHIQVKLQPGPVELGVRRSADLSATLPLCAFFI